MRYRLDERPGQEQSTGEASSLAAFDLPGSFDAPRQGTWDVIGHFAEEFMSTAATASTARPARLSWMTYAQWVLPIVIVAAMATVGGFIRYGHTHALRSPQLIGILVIAAGTIIAATCIATYVVWVLSKVRAHEETHALLLANQWRYLVDPDAAPLHLDDVAVMGDPNTTIGKAFRDNDTVPDSVEALKQAMTTGHLRAISPLMVPGSPVALAAIAEEKLNAASEQARAHAIAAAEQAVRDAAAPVVAPMENLDLDKADADEPQPALEAAPVVIDEHCPVHGHAHDVAPDPAAASECLVGTPQAERVTGGLAVVTEATPCARSDVHSTLDLGMYKDPRKTGAVVTPHGKKPGDMFSGSIPVVRRRLDTEETQSHDVAAEQAAQAWRADVEQRREAVDLDPNTDPIPVVAPVAVPAVQRDSVEHESLEHDDVPADLVEPPVAEPVVDEAARELGKVRRHAYRQFMINSAPARAVLVAVSTLMVVCAFLIGGQSLVNVPWSTEAMALKVALWIGCGVGCLGLMYMIGPGLAGVLKGVDMAYPEYTAPRVDKGARITLIVLGVLAVLVGYAGMYAISM